jgi:hypothetical protein
VKRFEGGKNNLNPRSEKGNRVGKKGIKNILRYTAFISVVFIFMKFICNREEVPSC